MNPLIPYTKTSVPLNFSLPSYLWSTKGSKCLVANETLEKTFRVASCEAATLSGYKNPLWKELVAQGDCATTPLSAYRERFKSTTGHHECRRKSHSCKTATTDDYWRFECVGFNTPSLARPGDPRVGTWSNLITTADNKALMALVASCESTEMLSESLVPIGEFRETLGLLRNGVRTLAASLEDYAILATKRARRAKRLSTLRRNPTARELKGISRGAQNEVALHGISDAWLQYSFALKPTCRDIETAVKAVENFGVQRATRVRGFGKAEEATTTAYNGSYSFLGWVKFVGTNQNYKRVKVIYTGSWQNRMSTFTGEEPNYGFDPKTLGLTLDRFVPALWELIPYSFLVDYFANVGDLIRAVSLRHFNIRWLQRTEIREYETVHQGGQFFPTYPNDFEMLPGAVPATYSWKRSVVSRAQYTGWAIPSFEWRIPGLDSLKWLNMAALLGSSKSVRSAVKML